MRIRLFNLWTVCFLAFSSLSLAYGQGEYATVIIYNNLNISYTIDDYYQTGNGFFGTQSGTLSPQGGYAAFTGDFFSNGDTAGFTIRPSNNPNCIDNPKRRLGLCYDAKFSYSASKPFPQVEIFEVSGGNSQPCKSCSFEFDRHNRDDITVTIYTRYEAIG